MFMKLEEEVATGPRISFLQKLVKSTRVPSLILETKRENLKALFSHYPKTSISLVPLQI